MQTVCAYGDPTAAGPRHMGSVGLSRSLPPIQAQQASAHNTVGVWRAIAQAPKTKSGLSWADLTTCFSCFGGRFPQTQTVSASGYGYTFGREMDFNHKAAFGLHPEAQLPACGSCSNPILAFMEHCDRRDGSDILASQLGELAAVGAIDVHKPVHVPDAEFLDQVGRVAMPLWFQTVPNCQSRCSASLKIGGRNIKGDRREQAARARVTVNDLHGDPTSCLVVMPHHNLGFHCLFIQLKPTFPMAHAL